MNINIKYKKINTNYVFFKLDYSQIIYLPKDKFSYDEAYNKAIEILETNKLHEFIDISNIDFNLDGKNALLSLLN